MKKGTFTPATSGISYSTNIGYYTKVGNLVHVHCYIIVNRYSSGSRVTIGGLPFTSLNNGSGDGHFAISATRFTDLRTNVTALYPMVTSNGTLIKCDALTDTSSRWHNCKC